MSFSPTMDEILAAIRAGLCDLPTTANWLLALADALGDADAFEAREDVAAQALARDVPALLQSIIPCGLPAVASSALLALRRLCRSKPACAAITDASGLDCVLAAVVHYGNNVDVLTHCCSILSNMCRSAAGCAYVAARVDFKALSRVIPRFVAGSAELAANMCAFLCNASHGVDAAVKAAIVAAGGVGDVVHALTTHPLHAAVQLNACGALSNLLQPASDAAIARAVVQAGALPLLVHVARTAGAEPCHTACDVLGWLAMVRDDVAGFAFVRDGVLGVILDALRRFQDVKVQAAASMALAQLVQARLYVRVEHEAAIVDAALAALRNVCVTHDARTTFYAYATLQTLIRAANAAALEAIPLAVQQLRRPPVPFLTEFAGEFLIAVCVDGSEAVIAKLRDADGGAAAVEALANQMDLDDGAVVRVLYCCCGLLANLGGRRGKAPDRALFESVVRAGGIARLRAVMRHCHRLYGFGHAHSATIIRPCCIALSHFFVFDAAAARALFALGAAATAEMATLLVAALKHYVATPEVAGASCLAIAHLILRAETVEAAAGASAVAAQGVEALLKVATVHHDAVASCVASARRIMCAESAVAATAATVADAVATTAHGIEALLKAATVHHGTAETTSALWALTTVAANSKDACRQLVATPDSVSCVLAALGRCRGDAHTETQVLWLLHDLAQWRTRQRVQLTPEAQPETAVDALERHESSIVASVVDVMMSRSADADVIRTGCKTLQACAALNRPAVLALARSNGIDAVVTAMRTFAADEPLQVHCVSVFHTCALVSTTPDVYAEISGAFQRADVPGAVRAAVRAHPGNDTLRRCKALVLWVCAPAMDLTALRSIVKADTQPHT